MDLVSIIALSILSVWALFSILIALSRGLVKSRIRGICLIVGAGAAIAVTLMLRDWVVTEDFLHEYLIPWLEKLDQTLVVELLELSPSLREIVSKTVAALAAPLACFALFLIFSFLTWIIYLMITLPNKERVNRSVKRRRLAPLRAAVWGVFIWAIGATFLLLPITAYSELAEPVDEVLLESSLLEDEGTRETYETISEVLKSLDTGVLKGYREVGGEWFCNTMCDFEIDDKNIHLAEEVDVFGPFVINLIELSETKLEEFGAREEEIFHELADQFEKSDLLPTLMGDIVKEATDSWLSGEKFMNAKKPSFDETEDIFGPFFDQLLVVLNQDAENPDALRADFNTIAELITVFEENGLFEALSDREDLKDVLKKDGLTEQIVSVLNANSTMCVLVDEITDMGLRVIAEQVVAPDVSIEEYEPMMEDVASALTELKTMPEEDRREYMNAELDKALTDAGIEDLDSTLIDLYADRLESELLEKETITADDVRDFFNKYYPGNVTN